MLSVSELNQRHGVSGQVSFFQDAHGFVQVEVTNAQASARVALQGAQLLHWAPAGQNPVIWVSDRAVYAQGKPVRGGAPICWPWFGPHDTRADFPAHGFARNLLWEPVSAVGLTDGSTRLILRLPGQRETAEQWPHDTSLDVELTIGRHLQVDLVTGNRGSQPVTVGQALHTYFYIGDIRQVRILGLDGCPYIDKVLRGERHVQDGDVCFDRETDRIYLDSTHDVVIDDPVMRRRIRVAKKGSASTVVWNPWREKAARMGDLGPDGYVHMVCVENANAADDVLILPARASHHLRVCYTVEDRVPMTTVLPAARVAGVGRMS